MTLGWTGMLPALMAALALSLPSARAQVTGQAGTGAGAAGAPAVQVYSNAELHLTFAYPAELTPRDGAFAAAVGRRMVYGAAEEQDPDHPVAETCTRVLLAVGKGSEPSGGAPGAWVRAGLVEAGAQCFPAKVFRDRKAMDVLLRNLVRQGTTVMGMMPLEQPARYEIEGHKANFCAAQGEPVTGSDLQTAGAQLIGVAAVAAEGSVVAWVIETNDAAMFNKLLGSGVDFGTGKAQRLFPAEVR